SLPQARDSRMKKGAGPLSSRYRSLRSSSGSDPTVTLVVWIRSHRDIFFLEPRHVIARETRHFHNLLQLGRHAFLVVCRYGLKPLFEISGFNSLDAVQLRGIEAENLP